MTTPAPKVHRGHPSSQDRETHTRLSKSGWIKTTPLIWTKAADLRQWCINTDAATYAADK